ncbi:primosomal protein N' [Fictibacillus barbaricus]|uniref:Replication restart protein PriA n=1 Tax=Fictibacillus barbaricus TaxID=182136 RepID=A0ABS2ZCJ7_9BACL|nr:primosomal protein N' [Fictibacillus barbaricus]MBN3545902.1 primosomal protein N' [Fictibacillus barbaricus]GGB57014.1 primosomal protein N' [Fictibacillus barbaricus]
MIAAVVVDVPSGSVNKTFDYRIPVELEGWAEPGMRVIVPFGPRKLQGFILEIKEDSTVKGMKNIIEILDPLPVLTSELIELGRWLAENTLSFYITAYQAMLPAAMKATYEKAFQVLVPEKLTDPIASLFSANNEINVSDITNENPHLLKTLQNLAKEGVLDVVYKVKNKANKKRVKFVSLASKDLAKDTIQQNQKKAEKQKALLRELVNRPSGEYPLQEILTETGASHTTAQTLVKKGILHIEEKEVYRDPFQGRKMKPSKPLPLTENQENAIKPILHSIENNNHQTVLLHGVTGSGKTEIYLQSIQSVLDKGKEAIVLVPEISLTPQMVNRFKGRFGSAVAVLHSGLSIGEKYDEWRKILRKEVSVVVGARSAIFAPFQNLGIVIIDEEHETSYKQEDHPRYHARDVAIWRGKFHSCPIVLGSATPALETYARAQKGRYQLAELAKRVHSNPMPEVTIIDMREELKNGNRSMFSKELMDKLKTGLEKGEQSVLFLNRRGYASFILCRDCGYVAHCPHCDISLTFHKRYGELKCHYCGYKEGTPSVCPSCSSEHIRFFGTGTQKVEEELAKVLPEARVIRMDVDTTSKKGSHEKLLTAFENGEADILLGTQMIAKGLDFPKVTLVGVLAADTMLHLPDFRASEKTFQLLTQVSGRAGRHELEGKVIVQGYDTQHYSIQLASKHDYHTFYNHEMQARKLHQYPPFYYLGLLTFSHPDLMQVVDASDKAATYLSKRLSHDSLLLGPVTSPIARVKDRYRYQVMIKYKNEPELRVWFEEIIAHFQKDKDIKDLQITGDLNAQTLM